MPFNFIFFIALLYTVHGNYESSTTGLIFLRGYSASYLSMEESSNAPYSSLINSLSKNQLLIRSIQETSCNLQSEINNMVSLGISSIYMLGHGNVAGSLIQNVSSDALKGGYVKGIILLESFLKRSKWPDINQCIHKGIAIKPQRSLLFPGGYLKDGSHNCFISSLPLSPDFPIPVLTIAGEFDGVVRITRIAEAFYMQRYNLNKFPVLVVRGMSHSSVLDVTPSEIKALDLEASISSAAAIEVVRNITWDFITAVESRENGKDLDGDETNIISYSREFEELEHATKKFLEPIIEAFAEQEGSWLFTRFDEEHGSSKWAADAQRLLCSHLPTHENVSWDIPASNNRFRLVSDEFFVPPYFRPQHRASVQFDAQRASLRSQTVTQLRYVHLSMYEVALGLNGLAIVKEEKSSILQSLVDDGSSFVSAIEIATKMRSRQYVARLVTHNMSSHDTCDTTGAGEGLPHRTPNPQPSNRCAAINQRAIDWAFAHLPSEEARVRYLNYGRKLLVGPDILPTPAIGPFWIWGYLQYNDSPTGDVVIQAPYALYALDANAYGAGTHYCKLLSPARAMEWMLVDSVRPR